MIDDTFKFGGVTPAYSITNLASKDAKMLDAQSPFSFYDFIKYTQEQLTPIQANDYYLGYLNEWHGVKKTSAVNTQQSIVERYTEFIKDISLNHLTYEEKRFISNIDFSDPEDLDIVIPFFSKKIREICNFYASKREIVKYKVHKNSFKGTFISIEKSIAEAITDFLFASENSELSFTAPTLELKSVLTSLDVEVEELYDIYTNYLNLDPTKTAETYDTKTQLRAELFSSNTNSIEADIFLNFSAALRRQIFSTVNIFLKSLKNNFTVNYNLNDVNVNCAQGDKLYDLVNANKARATRELLLKEQLIKKYIGSDFYYIQTGSTLTDVTSGILFKADNPSGNLLNRNFPSTASVEEVSELVSARKLGLFFAPDKQGILFLNAPNAEYSINVDKLQTNKLYIFPDPSRYGKTKTISQSDVSDYPLIHIEDYTPSIHNPSSYHAWGDIKHTPHDQSFFGYYSKVDRSTIAASSLSNNFSTLYNNGILTQYAVDIYGNEYGLLKLSQKQALNIDKQDDIALPSVEFVDGGPIKYKNGIALPEPSSPSSPLWPTPNLYTSTYYYNALYSGGVGNKIDLTFIRACNPGDGESYLPGNLLITPDSTSVQYLVMDGGTFSDVLTYEKRKDYRSAKHAYFREVLPESTTQLIEDTNDAFKKVDIDARPGRVFFKDIISTRIDTLSTSFSPILYKYNETIQQELNLKVYDFNVYNDVIYFITENYFVVEKFNYFNKIGYAGTENNYLHLSKDTASVSKPFFFENRDYSLVTTLSVLSADFNECVILPSIYRIDYKTAKLKKIFPNTGDYSAFLNTKSVKFVRVNQPILTYNSRNSLYAISTTVVDQNNLPYIYQVSFVYDSETVSIKDVRLITFLESSNTVNWYSTAFNSLSSSTTNAQITHNKQQGYIEIYG